MKTRRMSEGMMKKDGAQGSLNIQDGLLLAQALIAGYGDDKLGELAAPVLAELKALALAAKMGAWLPEGGESVILSAMFTAYAMGLSDKERADVVKQFNDSGTSE